MNCASLQDYHFAQEIFDNPRTTWHLPKKCKAPLKQDLLKLPIKGCILLRIFPHAYTPKLNTGLCLLGGGGQKLSVGPGCEFRCAGDKPWSPTCHSLASCPAHLQLQASWWPSYGHCVAAVASARCQGNAAADGDAAGCVRWPCNLGRQRGRNNMLVNMMLFISIAALQFWARTMQQEFNGMWYSHLDTSLFLRQIINSFSNHHGKNMTALYSQILYRKTYIPNLSENRVVKIQHQNI